MQYPIITQKCLSTAFTSLLPVVTHSTFIPAQSQFQYLFVLLSSSTCTHRRLFSIIEIDLGTSRSSSDGEFEALALKRLDDLIHGIIVQKSTPDWLPFVPGWFLFLGPTQTQGPRFGYQTRPSIQPSTESLLHHYFPWMAFLLNHGDGSAQPNEDLKGKESAETGMEVDIEVMVSDDTLRSENWSNSSLDILVIVVGTFPGCCQCCFPSSM